jgi:hypothetical protein
VGRINVADEFFLVRERQTRIIPPMTVRTIKNKEDLNRTHRHGDSGSLRRTGKLEAEWDARPSEWIDVVSVTVAEEGDSELTWTDEDREDLTTDSVSEICKEGTLQRRFPLSKQVLERRR